MKVTKKYLELADAVLETTTGLTPSDEAQANALLAIAFIMLADMRMRLKKNKEVETA